MSTSRHIDKICIAAVAVMLTLTVLFMCGEKIGLSVMSGTVKYESTLFDTSYVHKIDIVMNDWDAFLETCENEEYAACTVVVDGKKYANIAIRAKGNTSLSSVKASGTDRYSFKLEFDHYESAKNLDGLDKLCLNNLIQDNTMMKDYIVYRLMDDFGADSPLCSFAYLTVNGEDWGLYLAVEGVEDSFLSRNYGADAGDLYKPDSMSFGGGRGNGKGFNMDDFDFGSDAQEPQAPEQNGAQGEAPENEEDPSAAAQPDGGFPGMPGGDGGQGGFPPGGFPGTPGGNGGQGGSPPGGFPGMPGSDGGQGGFPSDGEIPAMPGSDGGQSGFPSDGEIPGMPGGNGEQGGFPSDGEIPAMPGSGQGGFSPGGGMGSDDVKLKYIDDDPESYPNIFDNAKTDVSSADQKRLIESLKKLSSYTDLEEALDTEEVLRYFVVHNFVCNGDSYTGSMIHNYYLHESDGKLAMIPWDYNLAFGTFQGNDAAGTVNASIDSPVSGSADDRPMVGWIFSDARYTERYHELFSKFLEKWFTNGELEKLIADTAEMIRPYVEKDPTKFCTAEEFEKGVASLSQFVSLRAAAVKNQLSGDQTTVDTGALNISDMGTMGGMRGGEGPRGVDNGAIPGGNGGVLSGQQPQDGTPGQQPQDGTSGQPQDAAPAQPPDKPDGQNGTAEDGGTAPQVSFPAGALAMKAPAAVTDRKTSFWVLTGISVLVLAAGLLVAIKKKY